MTRQDVVVLGTLLLTLVALVAYLALRAIMWYDSCVELKRAESMGEALDEFNVFDPGDEQPQH